MENETAIHQPSPVEEEEKKKKKLKLESLFFPQEIILEILSRLPVKSLCRFRCVSKHWLSLITCPNLAKSHLKKTITNDRLHCERRRVIIYWLNVYSLEYESIGRNDENSVALELYYPLKPPNVTAELLDYSSDEIDWESTEEDQHPLKQPIVVYNKDIFGSCNGLVCISPHFDILYLFNPSTRESKKIPDWPSGFGSVNRSLYSFGFCYVNDDYKIVKAGYCGVFVYSLRADSWRFVCHNPYHVHSETRVLLNGAFHWMACRKNDDDEFYDDRACLIAAFSLEEEAFFEMSLPDIVDSSSHFVVGVLNGCLCVLHNYNGMRDDFWLMTEYGVGEPWTKFTLCFSYEWMKPLCLAQNGETLLLVDGKLLLYNFEDGSYRYLVVDGIQERDHPFKADIYVETLISPNAAVGLEL